MPPLKKSERNMLIGVGISVAVFLIVDPYYLWRKKPSPPPAEGQSKPAQTAGVSSPGGTPIPTSPTSTAPTPARPLGNRPTFQRKEFAEWGRDPFLQTRVQYDAQQLVTTQFKLSGISMRGDNRYALINNQIVREGEQIGPFLVQSIRSDRVILTHQDRVYVLTMGGE